MSAFYDKMKGTAATLIDRFGQDILFERSVGSTINPVTGEVTTGVAQELKTRGILKNYELADIDGTLILSSDKKLLIDGMVKPLKTDKPKIGGEYIGVIISIREVAPDGTSLVFELQIRN